ncbi:hypothetical protein QCA50_016975 [Cerrena zonata]|uniref:Uncharacterized protein n=1 Tax=Cerrena zonata TaxID=2478898 RepID=A0AAW0FM33_9APHY
MDNATYETQSTEVPSVQRTPIPQRPARAQGAKKIRARLFAAGGALDSQTRDSQWEPDCDVSGGEVIPETPPKKDTKTKMTAGCLMPLQYGVVGPSWYME